MNKKTIIIGDKKHIFFQVCGVIHFILGVVLVWFALGVYYVTIFDPDQYVGITTGSIVFDFLIDTVILLITLLPLKTGISLSISLKNNPNELPLSMITRIVLSVIVEMLILGPIIIILPYYFKS